MEKNQRLGKYQIEMKIGSGAYADVYRATDIVLKRPVALKVLKTMLLADEEAFARFVQEAQVAAGLFHPHIATVVDLGEAEGRYFIAMRYVDGPALDDFIAEHVRANSDRLIGFAGIDPAEPLEALDELARAHGELGFKGIAVSPSAQDFHPSCTGAMRVLAEASRLDMPVLIHQGQVDFIKYWFR